MTANWWDRVAGLLPPETPAPEVVPDSAVPDPEPVSAARWGSTAGQGLRTADGRYSPVENSAAAHFAARPLLSQAIRARTFRGRQEDFSATVLADTQLVNRSPVVETVRPATRGASGSGKDVM